MSTHVEQREFQAETRQLLDLMIHSIYSNKDVFLRELISNASDALDKLRLESLVDKELPADTSDLHIEIEVDKDARTLTVRDNGIGMTRDEVVGLIGTIAKSGTAELLRKLRGRDVKLTHGLAETMEQLAAESPEFVTGVETFIDGLVSHYVLDGGRLVVAHAGLKEAYHGRASGRVRSFALYGEPTGETDEYGLPVRYPWARDYRGSAMVVYGHTPTPEPEWVNNTICLDTGCVFGGQLTALRYPE